jgi:SSS family solute:Na+ symporter
VSTLDIVLFVVSVVTVIWLGIWKSKGEETHSEHGAADYFLAGRGLTWWLVGFSLIAANISTEQFVGMSGQAANWLGMAIASYEWMAAITLVVVAFVFLPKLLKCGIYTIPEFLEYRFGVLSRTVMAIATMIILVGVPTASVIFSGAKVISVFFQGYSVLGLDLGNITVGCWIIAICAAIYVFVGGLKACAWTDLVWGVALIAGGVIVMALAFSALGNKNPNELIDTKAATSNITVSQLEKAGAWERFKLLNAGPAVEGDNGSGGKLHMVRPKSDSTIPWTVLVLGLWIPNFFYWGLNQYIMQRTLGSKSLAEGQKGIVFAAGLKLLIPFVVVIPGILAYNLYRGDLRDEAVDRNALVIASKSPALYEALSPAAKPDPALARKKNKVMDIDKALASARAQGGQLAPSLFEYNTLFATLHPVDAQVIARHNATVAGQLGAANLPAAILATAEPAAIVKYNETVLKAASGAKTTISTDRLLAQDYDAAFPTLLRNLMRPGISWFVLAAIFGAVVSSLAAMLNSASTIATMDIYGKFRKQASQYELVSAGRAFVVVFVLISALIAPSLGSPKFGGIFNFIQEFQGFISPGVLAVFIFGFLVHKAPKYLGWLGIAVNAVLYGAIKWWVGPWLCANGLWFSPEISFLDRMGLCLIAVLAICTVLTLVNPLPQPVDMPVNNKIPLETSKTAKVWGWIVVVATLVLYAIFW